MNYRDVTIENLLAKKNVFLTGGAGVGKTTITKEVIDHFENSGKKVAKLASTGMAATLIGGQTLHSFFDLGIASDLDELEQKGKLGIQKKVHRLISSMDLIVIDEISMVSDTLLEMIHYRLKQVDFSGAILIVGDFLQLPPIIKGYGKVRFAFESDVWREFDFYKIELTHIHRTDDEEFIKLLNHVRFGHIDEMVHNNLNLYIKPLPEDLSQFTFLFGKNLSASKHNKEQLSFLDGELFSLETEVVKHLKDVKDADIDRFLTDARVDKILELKIGVPVLFTRNSWNYFNGERGVVINVDNSFVYVQKNDLKIIKLEKTKQSKTRWVEKKIDADSEMVEEEIFSIYQYPIKLAFAITIHKSQGMSIEDLIIQTNEIFAPSQFYVALSRASNPKRLTLIAPKVQWHRLIYVNDKALNFVST